MKALCLSLVCFFTFLSQTQAESLVQRQKRLSVYHLSETKTGAELISEVGGSNAVFDSYIIDAISQEPKTRITQFSHSPNFLFTINAEILSSSPIYFAWNLAYALNQYKVAKVLKKHQLRSLPEFVELSQWHYYTAMKVWEEMNYPNEEDLANDKNSAFADKAKALRATPSRFARNWKFSKAIFLDDMALNHIELGRNVISLRDYVNTAQGAEKKAALELLQRIQKELPEL